MERETFSMREIALVLLSLVDAPTGTDMRGTGVIDRDYIGQSIHKLYLDRDALVRIAGLGGE
jgi:hypothetical protein